MIQSLTKPKQLKPFSLTRSHSLKPHSFSNSPSGLRPLTSGFRNAFTIVELLIVIVIIAILATLTVIAYNGVTNMAHESAIKNDIKQNTNALELHYASHRKFPTTGNESSLNDNSGILTSGENTYSYTSNGSTYCLEFTRGEISYHATDRNQVAREGTCEGNSPYTEFVFDTRKSDCNGTVYLPITSPTSGGSIDWGDGQTGSLSGRWTSHTYSTPGEYTVTYEGPINRAEYEDTSEWEHVLDYESDYCLVRVNAWGEGANPTAMNFGGAGSLVYVAEPPRTVTSMFDMFAAAESFDQPVGDWDVSSVRDMSGAFMLASSFNQPLNSWNVSNVETMECMFCDASSFNQPLNNWDVSNVQYMGGMFNSATSFNQPLNSWNVSNVETMECMFCDASSFNQPLNNWDVSNVRYMWDMFDSASSFNQPLNNWDVSSVEDMDYMFYYASSFNQNISNWDVCNVNWWDDFRDGSPLSNANTPYRFGGTGPNICGD